MFIGFREKKMIFQNFEDQFQKFFLYCFIQSPNNYRIVRQTKLYLKTQLGKRTKSLIMKKIGTSIFLKHKKKTKHRKIAIDSY